MNDKRHTTLRTVPKCYRKNAERGKTDTPTRKCTYLASHVYFKNVAVLN